MQIWKRPAPFRHTLNFCLLASAILFLCTPRVLAQTVAPAVTEPTNGDGLVAALQEVFAAEKVGDPAKVASLYTQFAIPNHKEWFLKTFGDKEGAGLDARYSQPSNDWAAHLKASVGRAQMQGKSIVQVQTFAKASDSSVTLVKAFGNAMTAPCALYTAVAVSSTDDKNPYSLGNFVYVDGGFRYIDYGVMQALSTAPVMRVRIAGDVAKPKLVNYVPPAYPPLARQNHVQGTVKLHVILSKEGTVRSVELVSGDPLLVEAATDAVKQWRYRPTLLNGMPIEVDTVVDVVFQLKN
jgi:TonB family protein